MTTNSALFAKFAAFMCTISFLFLAIQPTSQTELNIKTVRVVDYEYGAYTHVDRVNVIFRSNIPENDNATTFLYDELVSDFVAVAKEEKLIPLRSDNIYILDYTLLTDDDPLKAVEVDYWNSHPDQGELRGWVVKGQHQNPNDYSDDEIKSHSKSLSWMNDSIEEWIDELHDQLMNFNNSKTNLILLIHCQHGKDRTGEISGAYMLKYGRRSWEEVAATNWETANQHITFYNQRALTWFCYHLKYYQGYHHLTCTHENLDEDSIQQPALVGWDKTNEEIALSAQQDQNNRQINSGTNGYEIAFFSFLSGASLVIASLVIVIFVLTAAFFVKKRVQRNGQQNFSDIVDKAFEEEDL